MSSLLDQEFLNEYRQLREEIRYRLFSHLNKEQYLAVENGKGPVLCLAGAGSGKTMAMVYRILHLLVFGPQYQFEARPPLGITRDDLILMKEWLDNNPAGRRNILPGQIARLIDTQGVDPRSVLAITFTNKAAAEMKNRLSLMMGGPIRDAWVMTFHAACLRILRREINNLEYTSDFGIYDTQDQEKVVKGIIKELNLDDKKFPPRALMQMISRFKSDLKKPQDVKNTVKEYFEVKAAEVYEIYQKKLKGYNVVDFDDLIMLTVQLFMENSEILHKYQQRFQYIMVDEYQDTNHSQYVLVNLLAKAHQNLCVVGDDDQSIYAFRQADIRNILEFERDYRNAKVIKLEQNYRSTRFILEAANEVIRNNTTRKNKKLWTEKEEGDLLTRYQAADEQDEARFVAERIRDLANSDGNYRDCAVLVRTNAQTRSLEEWFIRSGIPYVIIGGFKFYERQEIKDIVAYLKVLVNPSDAINLERIINVPRRGIGEATVQKIREYSAKQGCSLYEGFKNFSGLGLGTKAARGVESFLLLYDKFKSEMNIIPVTELTEKIILESGYLKELEDEHSSEARSRIENLGEFLTRTQEYDKNTEQTDLEEFLGQISLISDLDNYEDQNQAAVIMTMHSAKGLEFPNVFLVGLEEGIFPHSRSFLEPEGLEEERRLCYVALTRAMKKIFLISARQRNLYGRYNRNEPSRFLKEIPDALYQEHKNETPLFPTRQAHNSASMPGARKVPPTGDYELGEKVEHGKWGQGVIIGLKGQDEDVEIQIAFPGQGIKTLLAKYAPLRKVK